MGATRRPSVGSCSSSNCAIARCGRGARPRTKGRNVSNFDQSDSQIPANIADGRSGSPLPAIVKMVTRSFRNGMNEASDLANRCDLPDNAFIIDR